MYWIDCDTASINKNNGGEYTPSSINAYSKQRVGDNGASAYNCYFKIDQQILSNGNTTPWQQVYPVGTPRLENHVEYRPTDSTIYDTNNGLDVTSQYYSVNGEVLSISNASEDGLKSVRISIYSDSQLKQLIDQKIIPITVNGQDGVNGVSGYNSAIVYLYKRSDIAPTINWTNSLTYDFVNSKLVAPPSGWSETIPNGDAPLYVTAATACSNSESDTIGYQEWSTPPTLLVKNGEDGQPGSPGLNSSVIFLYQRKSSAPSKPSTTLQYDFATGQITPQSGLAGWTQNIPQSDGNPCYVIQCIAISSENIDNDIHEWSDPVILVEDGKDGESVVSFEIYSPDGDTFTDDVSSITLQVYAYDGTTEITAQNANFQWQEYKNSSWVNYITTGQNGANVEYKSKNATILRENIINVSTYRCRMEYPKNSGVYYYSYYTLKDTTDIYMSEIKTIDGAVLSANKQYTIAYAVITKNGEEIDPLVGQIWTDVSNNPTESGLYYRINNNENNIVLQYYNNNSKNWSNSSEKQLYNYSWNSIEQNNISRNFNDIFTKVVLLNSNHIKNSATIECEIYSENHILSKCQLTFFDLNDPLVGNNQPSSPKNGQLWLDTSVSPYILKVYNGSNWDIVRAYSGDNSNIFISKPETVIYDDGMCYRAGDMWVVIDDEIAQIFDESTGSLLEDKWYPTNTMLICIKSNDHYDASDWRDASNISEIRNSLEKYQEVMKVFDDGFYLFGTSIEGSSKFYSQLSSTELGFYQRDEDTVPKTLAELNQSRGTKVVWISNKELHAKKANIDSFMVVKAPDENPNELPFIQIGNLKIQKESNNSYSILLI